MTAHVEATVQVGLDHRVEVFFAHAHHQTVAGNTGVVDQYIHLDALVIEVVD